MRSSDFSRRLLYWITVALGLVLAIVPLPDWLAPLRPDIALLAVIYWILTSPRTAGLGYAWLAGLFLDVLRGEGFAGGRPTRPPAGLEAARRRSRPPPAPPSAPARPAGR